MICEVESCIDDAGLTKIRLSSNQWTSIVRQQIFELEGSTYQYVPIFSTTVSLQVDYSLLKCFTDFYFMNNLFDLYFRLYGF